jgi:hypothetical protein
VLLDIAHQCLGDFDQLVYSFPHDFSVSPRS